VEGISSSAIKYAHKLSRDRSCVSISGSHISSLRLEPRVRLLGNVFLEINVDCIHLQISAIRPNNNYQGISLLLTT
jgi:hypothetical protein